MAALAAAATLCIPLAACAQMGATTGTTAQTQTQPQQPPAGAAAPDDAAVPAQAPREAVRTRLLPTTAAQADLPSRELTSQIMFQVLAAEIALQRGQVAPAYQTYLALARDTQDPRMAQRASEIAIGAQSVPDALTAARLWHQYAPSDPQASQLDASLLVLNGYLDEARPLLARQLAAVPDAQRGDAILSLQLLIARGSDRIGGIHALRELLQDDMQRPESYTAIGRQQIVANDAPGARASFLAALKLKPDYEPAALMLAQMGGDERHQAIAIVADYTAQHPNERNPRFLLAQLYLADNQLDPARQQFEAMRKMNPKDPAPLLALGLIAMQNKQERDAEKYFVAYADVADQQPDAQRVDAGPAYLYLAQMAADRKELATADHWLGKVDRGSNQYVAAQIARAQLQTSQKQYDQASATLAAVQPRNAREAVGLGRAEAAVLMQAGRYPQAEQKLGALLELVPDNPDVLYDYAMAAERNGHYDLMENELRRLIVIDPNNAQAYNALGYSLADRNQHLDEADKLVQKALALSPGDAYIMDSAGWVKYRMGDKDAAVDLLRRAYQAQPNAEIGAHLGTVLWSQGKQDEARQALHAAQQLDPTDETLIHTLDQLKLNPTP
ncbi:MAG: tetratricopeptide repeat protein [Janthinobacterium lividum]